LAGWLAAEEEVRLLDLVVAAEKEAFIN